jgi:hypothetical protein
MHRADARARQHGVGRLRDHRHVDGDPVTLLHTIRLHHVRKPADLLVELLVGDLLVVIRVVAFPDDRCLVATLLQVPVNAVVANVGDAVFEPLDRHLAAEAGVLDLLEGLEPVDALAVLGPELLRVLDRLLVHLEVAVIVNEGMFLPGCFDLVRLD